MDSPRNSIVQTFSNSKMNVSHINIYHRQSPKSPKIPGPGPWAGEILGTVENADSKGAS